MYVNVSGEDMQLHVHVCRSSKTIFKGNYYFYVVCTSVHVQCPFACFLSMSMYNYLIPFCTCRLISDLHKKLSTETLSISPHKKSWEDFVDDLWKNNLSDFRNGSNYSYAVVSTADQKRRVYSLRNIDRNDEDLLNDLMNAGVSESNLLPDTDAEEYSGSSRSPSLNSRWTQPSIIATGVPDDEDDVENSFASTHQGTCNMWNTCKCT